MDLDAFPFSDAGQGHTQLIHLILEGNGLFLLEDTAQLTGLFAEGHIMAPAGCGDSRGAPLARSS